MAMDERAAFAVVIGRLIQRLRSGGTSQQALAIKAGLSQSALSRFENGQSVPDLYETRRLAMALGYKPEAFMGLIEQSFARTAEVAQKVSKTEAWEGLAAVAVGGLALLGVMAILEESAKKAGKKSSR
jgi:transcriptional regulator with XRE-family HTH domain